MRSVSSIFCLLFFCLCAWQSVGQRPAQDIDLQQFIEDNFALQDPESGANYEDIYEALYQLYLEPLDLNTAGRDELASLFILQEYQINNFLAYRARYGRLISIYELQAIPGFDLETIQKLLPFVTVAEKSIHEGDGSLLSRILHEENNYLVWRMTRTLETQEGYTPPTLKSDSSYTQRYAGSPYNLYARFRVSHIRDFSLGFTAEKDAGEAFAWNPAQKQYGMDFYSYHLVLWNKKRFKAIALGDYQIQIGQGLLLGAGFRIGKGAETVQTIRRSSTGIRPFTSVLETGFFRGAAATYELLRLDKGSIDLTAFASWQRQDANVQTLGDTLDEQTETFISSIQTAGFHRTPTELAAKDAIDEQVGGANVTYKSKDSRLEVGLTGIYTRFGVPLKRTPTTYNQFEFNGQQNYNVGLHYSYNWQNFNFFGEAARSQSGGMGIISGVLGSLTPTLEMALLYRNYARDFHSFYGNALAENSRPINERGFYWGMKFMPFKQLSFAAYYDKFAFPWLKYKVDAPSQGYEYLFRVTYAPTRRISMYAQYREENKEENVPDNDTAMDFLGARIRRNYWLVVRYAAEKYIGLQSRLQFSSFTQNQKTTRGLALAQDINLSYKQWELATRFVVFDTDDYQNRQYMYERNVLYTFSLPAYQDQGYRYFVMLRYNVTRQLHLWIRYAQTRYLNTDTIGSGLEEIRGNRRSELRLQVRYRF
ncbi:MAG: hypothetical protein KatS3mg033_0709 [Thermonema sp.]|uniref:helix-hairpin-helix domain-containing protein n=1 Tax=Thermonema sp. TaxID=2231181 RepID=UPI0021DBB125|nr:helix-hairpin-helix domain-containing protein [Thermonema sp.]GIV38909.1 MAG: hypothetical protein KatS3mg033_0709 [Thermonema sp.]